MTCGWCGGSIASANKPHTKGECEMTKVELEWMHAHKKHQEELKALQAKYDALEQAARKAKDALSKYYTLKNNGTGINYAYNLLSGALLDGEK